jgi:hypothetical protein
VKFGAPKHGIAGLRKQDSVSSQSVLAALSLCSPAFAQPVAGGACKPVSQRTGEAGCWIIAHEAMSCFGGGFLVSSLGVAWHQL